MAGSSAITAVEATRNDGDLFSTAAPPLTSTGAYAYLDVSDMDASKVIFVAEQTGALVTNIVVKDGAQYTGGTIGDLTVTTTGAKEYLIGPLETHRFKDSNGRINLAKSTASTSVTRVRAILLP
jgi:hypothetical protein